MTQGENHTGNCSEASNHSVYFHRHTLSTDAMHVHSESGVQKFRPGLGITLATQERFTSAVDTHSTRMHSQSGEEEFRQIPQRLP